MIDNLSSSVTPWPTTLLLSTFLTEPGPGVQSIEPCPHIVETRARNTSVVACCTNILGVSWEQPGGILGAAWEYPSRIAVTSSKLYYVQVVSRSVQIFWQYPGSIRAASPFHRQNQRLHKRCRVLYKYPGRYLGAPWQHRPHIIKIMFCRSGLAYCTNIPEASILAASPSHLVEMNGQIVQRERRHGSALMIFRREEMPTYITRIKTPLREQSHRFILM